MKAILGKKILMTRIFDKTGKQIPVTLVKLENSDKLSTSQLKEGEVINVTGTSKGKGFAGTVKRHHFHLGPKTHGSDNYRRPGSIGATYPERVIKGHRMAGHLGHARTTVKNLKVIKVDPSKKEILISGAIPGPRNAGVLIWSNLE